MPIRNLRQEDRQGWEKLYRGYADFYKATVDDEMPDRLWGWLMDDSHDVKGLVAEENGTLVGMAHYSRMPSPLRATDIGFLHDLFVDPETRRGGIGAELIAEVKGIGEKRGWRRIRWITRDNNYRARSMYDKVSSCSDWKVYELDI